MSKLTPHQVKEFYQLPEKVVFCKNPPGPYCEEPKVPLVFKNGFISAKRTRSTNDVKL